MVKLPLYFDIKLICSEFIMSDQKKTPNPNSNLIIIDRESNVPLFGLDFLGVCFRSKTNHNLQFAL